MAPTRARAKTSSSSKSSSSKSRRPSSSKSIGSSSASSKSRKTSISSKSRAKARPPTGGEVKALPSSLKGAKDKRKQRRTYTEKELGIAPLNKIVPAGVHKHTSGKRRGKVFVDDAESMRRIWAIVRAEKDRDVEGKVQRERQLEEVREARRVEAQRKEEARKTKLEETKDSLRRGRKKSKSKLKSKSISTTDDGQDEVAEPLSLNAKPKKSNTKRVSFA